MSKRIVYLAGALELEGDTWRKRAGAALAKMNFIPLDPVRRETIKKVGKYAQSDMSDLAVVNRDLNDLKRMELSGGFVLMNLNNSSDGRRPMGTLFELEWCRSRNIPVVAIMGRECDSSLKNHPWVSVSVIYKASSVQDALTFIESYLAEEDELV